MILMSGLRLALLLMHPQSGRLQGIVLRNGVNLGRRRLVATLLAHDEASPAHGY